MYIAGLGYFVVKNISLQRVKIKNASFSMTGMCCGQNHQFQHGLNVLWSISSGSAWLSCVDHGNNCQFQHGLNVSWSKLQVLAWLECVDNICFSIAGMCHGQNC
jgi:hypothetical protein